MPDPTPEEIAAQAAAEAAAAEQAAADTAAAEERAKDTRVSPEEHIKRLNEENAKHRRAAKEAEKVAKAAQDKLDAIEAEQLSDREKAERRAEAAEARVAAATEKLRRANLLTALSDKGLVGTKAQAAAKLIGGVEYGDDDEPTNLDYAITAATTLYGEDMFKGLKPKAPRANAGDGSVDDGDKPNLTADELAAAKSFGIPAEEYFLYKDLQPVVPDPAK